MLYLSTGVNKMEKPGEDATMVEMARWLEDGFWDSFAEGIDTENQKEKEGE
jgi:hypothetical protein